MSEDFLTRWARLKRESAAEPARPSEEQATNPESPPRDAASASAIDVSSLPPIESISAESGVAAFLRPGVPHDLTRAALRKAWTSDPAIRDFVGIAENQWDFNAEGAMAGFGSLSAEEYAQHLAALARRAAGEKTESSGTIGVDDSTEDPQVPGACASPPQTHPIASPPVGEPQTAPANAVRVSETDGKAQVIRTHGSALPK